MSFIPLTPTLDLLPLSAGSTLLLPAVSTGNVPQLTVDLLLASLPHTLLGNFHSAHVQPCVGGDALMVQTRKKKNDASADQKNCLTTALQLWHIPSLRLLVLQQRAPVFRGRHRAFVNELLQWASSIQLNQIIMLTSSLAFRKGDEELDAAHPVSFFFVDPTSSTSSSSSSTLTLLRETLQFTSLQSGGIARGALEQDEQPYRYDQLNSAEDEAEFGQSLRETVGAPLPRIPVPGLGITRLFYEIITGNVSNSDGIAAAAPVSSVSSSSVSALAGPTGLPPTLFLSVYVNEGANDRDAMLFCHHLYTLLFLQITQQSKQQAQTAQHSSHTLTEPEEMVWTPPAAWSSVFGNEPSENLYL
jgi:hypothetical protein